MPAGGVIINISSKASTHPSPFTVVYAAAKAGLNVLTAAAAQEFGPRGIRVNGIICGTFDTDSLRRSITTDDAWESVQQRGVHAGMSHSGPRMSQHGRVQ